MDLNMRLHQMSSAMKTQLYIENLTSIFNPQALFSDGTENYRFPAEPEVNDFVTIRLRTGRENVDSAYLVVDNNERYLMRKTYNDRYFDYYEYEIQLGFERMEYYFEIHSGFITCYYNSVGVCNSVETYYNFWMMPSFKTPAWAKGAIFYQIYVDRFYNGDPSNDVLDDEYYYIGDSTRRVTDWN